MNEDAQTVLARLAAIEPWHEYEDCCHEMVRECFFCGEGDPHTADCIWRQAVRLSGREEAAIPEC
jgi:hypothetical protein